MCLSFPCAIVRRMQPNTWKIYKFVMSVLATLYVSYMCSLLTTRVSFLMGRVDNITDALNNLIKSHVTLAPTDGLLITKAYTLIDDNNKLSPQKRKDVTFVQFTTEGQINSCLLYTSRCV